MWWNWLSKPHSPWARLWQAKYARGSQWHDLIRINSIAQGSPIWNAAKIHSRFIQEHSFWEIHSGTLAKLWEDSWQQLPKLENLFQMPLWQSYMQQENLIQVHQFWQQTQHQEYQIWRPANSWQRDWASETYLDLDQELTQRRIRYSNQQDKLRWDHKHKGTFTTKEAHQLRYSDTQGDQDQLWARVWLPGLWPKISTFLWLLSKRRILTWDNLIKRGFIGPSRCPNCNLHTETISHLMETCPLAKELWEKVEKCNKRTAPRGEDVTDNIRSWDKNPFKSQLLNTLWGLIPGFLYWLLWKERNSRIFNNTSRTTDALWLIYKRNIQETLAIRTWYDTDMPEAQQERDIFKEWNLDLSAFAKVITRPPRSSTSPSSWSPPACNSFKLNFDGAAKGNPGPAGFGGIIRSHTGAPLHIYYGSLGKDTNNVAEMEGLWQGICLAE